MSTYPASPAYSFPVVRRLEFETRIWTGRDGTEQRAMIRPGRESWDLSYPRLSLTQRDTLLAAHEAEKGAAGQAISFTFLGTAYTTCYFADDALAFTETDPAYYSGTVRLAQVVRAVDSGSLAEDFPALANGCITQRPYAHGQEYDTVAVRTEGGRYARSNRTGQRRSWTVGGTAITMAEAGSIWDQFRRARGMLRTFHFTDPESSMEYTAVRFASDTLEWRYVEAGHSSLTATLVQAL